MLGSEPKTNQDDDEERLREEGASCQPLRRHEAERGPHVRVVCRVVPGYQVKWRPEQAESLPVRETAMVNDR